MRKLLLLLIVTPWLLMSCNNDLALKVISFNIRYDNPRDGENAWNHRKELAVSFLAEEQPDIFGLQEALWHQYVYIDSVLAEYASVGVGRGDGIRMGEMTPVFFNRKRFDLLESDTFWLSENPEIPGSRGWGAVLPRIVTWVKLLDKDSKQEFYYFNTHYSHMSDSARIMSSYILSEQVKEITGNDFFVITGDFNMTPQSEAYAILTENSGGRTITDTYLISETEPGGLKYTFNGFKDIVGSSRIDYIFADEAVLVKSHSTVNIKKNGVFISDHWPVVSSITWDF